MFVKKDTKIVNYDFNTRKIGMRLDKSTATNYTRTLFLKQKTESVHRF